MKVFYLFIFISIGFSITTQNIYDNSWALIIGIDKYESVRKLNYAVKDAESMQEILLKTFEFPFENVTLLTNEQANKQNILKSFSDITKNANANDRVIIFFAGHGETMDLPEGGEMGYLLPVDGNREDLYLSSIGMDELKKLSLMSKAKHVLYLIDACYGGIAAIGSRGLEPETTPNYIEKITKDKSRQIITAGGKGEQVIEKSEWGHSAFSLNLKRGLKEGRADLNSDGYITANELALFLSEKVTIDSENQQTPQFGRMTSQEGEFVFIYSENTIINQQAKNNTDNGKMDLILDKLSKLEKQASDKTTIDDDEQEEVEDDWNDEDVEVDDNFEDKIFFYFQYLNTENYYNIIPNLTCSAIGGAYDLDFILFSIAYLHLHDKDHDNSWFKSKYYFEATGIQIGFKKIIIEDYLDTQISFGIINSIYDRDSENKNDYNDKQLGYNIGLNIGTWWEEDSDFKIIFNAGYDFNDIENENNEKIFNGLTVGIGIQMYSNDYF